MGLFSREPKVEPLAFSQQEAFFGIIYLSLLSFGDEFTDEDFSRFNVVINRMKLFKGFTNEMSDIYLGRIEPYTESDWEGFIEQAAAILPSDLRETAYAVACDIVLREGVVPVKATGFLEMVRDVLGINQDTGDSVFEAMQIKNRG